MEATSSGFVLQYRRQVTEQVARTLPDVRVEASADNANEEGSTSLVPRVLLSTELADIDNDGETELIVQRFVGAHSSELQAYGWRSSDPDAPFELLASASAEYGDGFAVGDFDGDGRTEIANIEVDRKKLSATAAAGPFVEVLRRWDGRKFAEVGRRELRNDTPSQVLDRIWVRPQPPRG
jgi:hypothetical protein